VIKRHFEQVRLPVDQFHVHLRFAEISPQVPSRRKQCSVYDATGLLVGYVNQYSGSSYAVRFTRRDKLPIQVVENTLLNSHMQVRQLLNRATPRGHYEWH
jgi:hypothetical protein